MGVRVGVDFQIESITCHEFKVVGGTDKAWTFHGAGPNTYFKANDEWQRAYRPKIGGYMVTMHDPANPGRPNWVEYFTPTKYANLFKRQILKDHKYKRKSS